MCLKIGHDLNSIVLPLPLDNLETIYVVCMNKKFVGFGNFKFEYKKVFYSGFFVGGVMHAHSGNCLII